MSDDNIDEMSTDEILAEILVELRKQTALLRKLADPQPTAGPHPVPPESIDSK